MSPLLAARQSIGSARGFKWNRASQIRSHGKSLAQKPLRKTPTILRAALFEGGARLFWATLGFFGGSELLASRATGAGSRANPGGVGGSARRGAGNIQSFCHYGLAGLPPFGACRPRCRVLIRGHIWDHGCLDPPSAVCGRKPVETLSRWSSTAIPLSSSEPG